MSDRIYRDSGGRRIPGVSLRIYIHNGDKHYLADLKVFQDGMVDCWGLIPFDALREKVDSGWVVTTLPEGARVSIYPLGDFSVSDVFNLTTEEDLLLEVADHIEALNGRPTSEHRCLTVLRAYKDAPTEEHKSRLREAYEAIPSHKRQFVLGDMDLKDLPIRMIVYGPGELENWSHRMVAREEGLPLPEIDVKEVLERFFPGPELKTPESPYMALTQLYREVGVGESLFPKETLPEVHALFKSGRGQEGLDRVLADLRGVQRRSARRPVILIQLAEVLSLLGAYLEKLERRAEAVELHLESCQLDPDGGSPRALARMAVQRQDASLARRWVALMKELGIDLLQQPDAEGIDVAALRLLLG